MASLVLAPSTPTCPKAAADSIRTLRSGSGVVSLMPRAGTATCGSGLICPSAQAALRRISESGSVSPASRAVVTTAGNLAFSGFTSGPMRPSAHAAFERMWTSLLLSLSNPVNAVIMSRKLGMFSFAARPIFPIAQAAAPLTFGSS